MNEKEIGYVNLTWVNLSCKPQLNEIMRIKKLSDGVQPLILSSKNTIFIKKVCDN